MEEENNFSIKKMWKITNPSKIHFISGLILSIVSSVISLIIPLLIKDIMDELSNGISFGLISQISILLILEIIFSAFSLYLLSKVGEEIVKNLREKLA